MVDVMAAAGCYAASDARPVCCDTSQLIDALAPERRPAWGVESSRTATAYLRLSTRTSSQPPNTLPPNACPA